MRILITGATGFVGQHLMTHLSQHPAIVPVAGVRTESQAAGRDTMVLGSLGSDKPPSLAGLDSVVHCAARVHIVQDEAADPLTEFRRLNVAGSVALAERAAGDGVKRFVFLSSVKVNGERTQPGHPYTPEDAAAPVDSYGVSKAEAEVALRALAERTGLELVIVRPVLVYGPGVKGNFLSLLRLLNKGIPLPLAGLDNRRSMVSVTNLCDLIATCLVHERAPGKVFFAADAQSQSTTQLICALAGHLDRQPRLFRLPPALLGMGARLAGRKDQFDRLFGSLEVSIEANSAELGWTPVQSSSEGLKHTADWYRTVN